MPATKLQQKSRDQQSNYSSVQFTQESSSAKLLRKPYIHPDVGHTDYRERTVKQSAIKYGSLYTHTAKHIKQDAQFNKMTQGHLQPRSPAAFAQDKWHHGAHRVCQPLLNSEFKNQP